MSNVQNNPRRGPTEIDRREARVMEADVRAGRRKDPRVQFKEDLEAMHWKWLPRLVPEETS